MVKRILEALAGLLAIPAIMTALGGLTYDEFVISMATITGVGTLTLMFTEIIKNLTKWTGWVVRIVSWVIALGLIFASDALGLGFGEYEWWGKIIIGIFVGLATNGAWTIEEIQVWLKILFDFLKPKEPEVVE